MNRVAFALFLLMALNCSYSLAFSQGGHFTLRGNINGQQRGIVTLTYMDKNGVWIKDSCVLQKARFHFAGDIAEPVSAHLRGNVRSQADDDPNAVDFYIEPAAMTMILERDHFKQMKIKGSKTQGEYEQLQNEISKIDDKSNDLFEKLMVATSRFINAHPSSYVSAFELLIFAQQLPLDTVNVLYHRLSPAVQQSQYGKEIYPLLQVMLGSLPGRMAADFNADDINGRELELSLFKGRYVLLDFWASWCVPCREGAPYLRTQFARYHPLGLEIIGIADDDEYPGLWKKAVEKDSTGIWYNVLRGQKKDHTVDYGNVVSINDKYAIKVLPSKILIDKNGVILGRYEGTEQEPALYKKLGEIFNQ